MKKKFNKVWMIVSLFITILLIALLALSFIMSSFVADPSLKTRNFTPAIIYGTLFLISIAVIVFYTVYFKSHKNIWALLILVSISISLIGYFTFSLSTNISEALLANKISYFGNVFLLLFSIFLISNVLRIRLSPWLRMVLFTLSCVMFIFSATPGYTDFFYKNASFSVIDGYVKIAKDYGLGHTIYLFYIALYAGIIVFLLIYSYIKKKKVPSIYIILFSVICIINVLAWFLEMLIPHNIEYLSFTYVIGEIILMNLYDILVKNKAFDAYLITVNVDGKNSNHVINLMVRKEQTHNLSSSEEHKADIDLKDLDIDSIKELLVNNPSTKDLTNRELDVAVYLLKDLKRKEIANNLFVSEDTVKSHTSHIFQKLHVSSREDLKETITKNK